MPLVTPLHPDGTPDLAGMRRVLAHCLAGGVDNVFVLGTNGEFQAFDVEETEGLIRAVGEMLRAMLPRVSPAGTERPHLLAGIGAPSLKEAVRRGKAAVRAGADALVACPPYYFIYRPDELCRFFLELADSLERPVIAYNSPRYTNNPLTAEIVRELARHPNIAGVKDSSGDDSLLASLIAISREAARQEGEFIVTQGAERKLLAGIRMGVHGITPGLANIAPGLCSKLWRLAGDASRSKEAEAIQERLNALAAIHTIRSGIAGTKAALAELGLCGPTPVAPFAPLDGEERRRVRRILEEAGLLDRAAV